MVDRNIYIDFTLLTKEVEMNLKLLTEPVMIFGDIPQGRLIPLTNENNVELLWNNQELLVTR